MKRLPASLAAAVVGVAVVLGTAGCLTFRRPVVTFRGVEVRSFGSEGADLEATFDVTNPNSYKIGVERLTYRLTVNGQEAGGGTIETATPLPAKETTQARLPLTLDWEKLKSAGLGFMILGGVDYAVEGEITFSTPLGTFHRPYRHEGRYSPLSGQ